MTFKRFFFQQQQKRLFSSKPKKPIDLARYCGSINTPFDRVESSQHSRLALQIVDQHTLGVSIAIYAMEAWHTMTQTYRDILEPPIVNVLFEKHFAQTLPCYDWKRGRAAQHEKDIVCIPRPIDSIEVKTTSNWMSNAVQGPSANSVHNALQAYLVGKQPQKSRDGYHLVVGYCKEKLELKTIRFGWLQDIDFVSNSLQSDKKISFRTKPRCPVGIANARLVTLYDDLMRRDPLLCLPSGEIEED